MRPKHWASPSGALQDRRQCRLKHPSLLWGLFALAVTGEFFASVSRADEHYVSPDGLAIWPFTNWSQAAKTI